MASSLMLPDPDNRSVLRLRIDTVITAAREPWALISICVANVFFFLLFFFYFIYTTRENTFIVRSTIKNEK